MAGDQRTPERLRHHFEVEKELADRIRASSREERTELFSRLYDELFERVPDHPRLVRRETAEDSRRSVEARMAILGPHLGPEKTQGFFVHIRRRCFDFGLQPVPLGGPLLLTTWACPRKLIGVNGLTWPAHVNGVL